MKTLTLDELVELGRATGMSDAEIRKHVQAIENAMASLAQECAQHLNVEHCMTLLDEAGLCASFGPVFDGQSCPDLLNIFDRGGSFV